MKYYILTVYDFGLFFLLKIFFGNTSHHINHLPHVRMNELSYRSFYRENEGGGHLEVERPTISFPSPLSLLFSAARERESIIFVMAAGESFYPIIHKYRDPSAKKNM